MTPGMIDPFFLTGSSATFAALSSSSTAVAPPSLTVTVFSALAPPGASAWIL